MVEMTKKPKKEKGTSEAMSAAIEEQKEEAAEKLPAAKETPQKDPMVYVGPPIKGTILHSTFTIFLDGIPKEYRDHPTFKHLFVPPGRLDQARQEIGKTGSLRSIHYKRAVEETSKKASDTSWPISMA